PLVPPGGWEDYRHLLQQVIDGQPITNVERRRQRKDGTPVDISIMGAPVYGAQGVRSVISIVLDVTEQKRMEEERRKLEAQVQHTQKLESLGVGAGGTAHAFNTLRPAVLGNASLALRELSPASAARPLLEGITKAAERAADLTRQLLAYAGKGRFVVQALSLADLVQEMAALLQTAQCRPQRPTPPRRRRR